MPSSTVEDYLKAIYQLSRQEPEVKQVPLGAITSQLSLTAGTVTTMMKYLQSEDYLNYEPRKGVTLKQKGEKAALEVLRRHRLIETFLVEVLKLDWADVHAEAEVLEHAISDTLIERIDDMLGHPTHDPHGDPIPTVDGQIIRESFIALSEATESHYQLMRVTRDDADYLNWLSKHELHPGQTLRVLSRDELAGVITMQIGDSSPFQISQAAAKALLVKPR